jgi:hypothetical protein
MWTCPQCKERIEDQFDSCWQCAGEAQEAVSPLSPAANSQSAISKPKKICRSLLGSMCIGFVALVLVAQELATGRLDKPHVQLLFPYALWVERCIVSDRLFNFLLFGQFPCYGAIYAWAWCRERQKRIIILIVATHLAYGLSLSHLTSVERRYGGRRAIASTSVLSDTNFADRFPATTRRRS